MNKTETNVRGSAITQIFQQGAICSVPFRPGNWQNPNQRLGYKLVDKREEGTVGGFFRGFVKQSIRLGSAICCVWPHIYLPQNPHFCPEHKGVLASVQCKDPLDFSILWDMFRSPTTCLLPHQTLGADRGQPRFCYCETHHNPGDNSCCCHPQNWSLLHTRGQQ